MLITKTPLPPLRICGLPFLPKCRQIGIHSYVLLKVYLFWVCVEVAAATREVLKKMLHFLTTHMHMISGDKESLGKRTLIVKLQGNEDPKKGAGLEYCYIDIRDAYREGKLMDHHLFGCGLMTEMMLMRWWVMYVRGFHVC